nr:hypothetical protein HK105_006598 [Polyrhizophydium stewartii]
MLELADHVTRSCAAVLAAVATPTSAVRPLFTAVQLVGSNLLELLELVRSHAQPALQAAPDSAAGHAAFKQLYRQVELSLRPVTNIVGKHSKPKTAAGLADACIGDLIPASSAPQLQVAVEQLLADMRRLIEFLIGDAHDRAYIDRTPAATPTPDTLGVAARTSLDHLQKTPRTGGGGVHRTASLESLASTASTTSVVSIATFDSSGMLSMASTNASTTQDYLSNVAWTPSHSAAYGHDPAATPVPGGHRRDSIAGWQGIAHSVESSVAAHPTHAVFQMPAIVPAATTTSAHNYYAECANVYLHSVNEHLAFLFTTQLANDAMHALSNVQHLVSSACASIAELQRIAAAEEANNAAQSKIAKSQSDAQQLEIKRLTDSLDAAQSKIADKSVKVARLEATVKELQARNAAITDKAKQNKARAREILAQNKEVGVWSANMQAQMQGLETRLHELDAANKQLQVTIDTLAREKIASAAELERVRGEAATAKTAHQQEMAAQVAQAEARCKIAEESAARIAADHSRAARDVDRLNADLASLREAYHRLLASTAAAAAATAPMAEHKSVSAAPVPSAKHRKQQPGFPMPNEQSSSKQPVQGPGHHAPSRGPLPPVPSDAAAAQIPSAKPSKGRRGSAAPGNVSFAPLPTSFTEERRQRPRQAQTSSPQYAEPSFAILTGNDSCAIDAPSQMCLDDSDISDTTPQDLRSINRSCALLDQSASELPSCIINESIDHVPEPSVIIPRKSSLQVVPYKSPIKHYRDLPWQYIEAALEYHKVRGELFQRRLRIFPVRPASMRTAKRSSAIITIQAHWRGYVTRKRFLGCRMRFLVAVELVETEASYLQGLFSVIKCAPPIKQALTSAPKGAMTRDDFSLILLSIEKIANTSATLLYTMVKRLHEWHINQTVGDLFERMSAPMKVYYSYFDRYPDAIKYFSLPEAVMEMEAQAANQLQDLLITPIQRLPRYLILIREMLKHTGAHHPDTQRLNKACEKLDQTIRWVDGSSRIEKELKKIGQCIRDLPFPLYREGRRLLFAAPLEDDRESPDDSICTSNPIVSQRFLFLFSDIILGAETILEHEATAHNFQFRWALALADITKIEAKEDIPFGNMPRKFTRLTIGWKTTTQKGTHLIPDLKPQDGRIWLSVSAVAQ